MWGMRRRILRRLLLQILLLNGIGIIPQATMTYGSHPRLYMILVQSVGVFQMVVTMVYGQKLAVRHIIFLIIHTTVQMKE